MKKQSKYQEVVSYLKNGIESGTFSNGKSPAFYPSTEP